MKKEEEHATPSLSTNNAKNRRVLVSDLIIVNIIESPGSKLKKKRTFEAEVVDNDFAFSFGTTSFLLLLVFPQPFKI